jgi:deoxyribodipyrimidine photolyase-like uncharacterized protein
LFFKKKLKQGRKHVLLIAVYWNFYDKNEDKLAKIQELE